jgi:hypothetical protein
VKKMKKKMTAIAAICLAAMACTGKTTKRGAPTPEEFASCTGSIRVPYEDGYSWEQWRDLYLRDENKDGNVDIVYSAGKAYWVEQGHVRSGDSQYTRVMTPELQRQLTQIRDLQCSAVGLMAQQMYEDPR